VSGVIKDLTPSQKGAVAEAALSAAAMELGVMVLRPVCEGYRYDLIFDLEPRLLRVQCKWAARCGEVLMARCATCRLTPSGYVRSTYSADEVDAIALYAPAVKRCYLLPIEEAADRKTISLRLAPTANNQASGIRWARDYELANSLERYWPRAAVLHPRG
jgi:hypothetical protein